MVRIEKGRLSSHTHNMSRRTSGLLSGQWEKIIPHLSCLLVRLLRYILRHISRYAPEDVPCRRTKIRRNFVELTFSTGLIE
jgi:hypothetical protein